MFIDEPLSEITKEIFNYSTSFRCCDVLFSVLPLVNYILITKVGERAEEGEREKKREREMER